MKWGEYSSDVHFILQRTALDATTRNSIQQQNNKSSTARLTKTSVDPLHGFTPPLTSPPPPTGAVASVVTTSPSKDLKKSLTFSGAGRAASPAERARLPLNVGVVRGVPKRLDNNGLDDHHNNGRAVDWAEKSLSSYNPPQVPPPPPSHSHYQDNQSTSNEGQLVYPRYDPPYGRVRLPAGSNGSSNDVPPVVHYSSPPPPPPPPPHHQQQDSSPQNDSVRFPPPYRNPPPPFAGKSHSYSDLVWGSAAAASPESYFSSCASFPIFFFQQKWENVVVMEGAIGRRNCVVVKNSRDAVRPRISVAPAEKGGIKKKPLRNQ